MIQNKVFLNIDEYGELDERQRRQNFGADLCNEPLNIIVAVGLTILKLCYTIYNETK